MIAGLDRTAADLSIIVEYGRPLELKKQSGIDLAKIIRDVATNLNAAAGANGGVQNQFSIESNSDALVGEFDTTMLSSALNSISVGAMKLATSKKPEAPLQIQLKNEAGENKKTGVIEWKGFDGLITIRFIRSPAAMRYDCHWQHELLKPTAARQTVRTARCACACR